MKIKGKKMDKELTELLDAHDINATCKYANKTENVLQTYIEICDYYEQKEDYLHAVMYAEAIRDFDRVDRLLEIPGALEQAGSIITFQDMILLDTLLGLDSTPGIKMHWTISDSLFRRGKAEFMARLNIKLNH